MEPLSLGDVQEARSRIEEGWDELETAIEAARQRWDLRSLAPEDGGTDPWSPRLAAWHAIAGERFRVLYLEHLLGEAPEAPPSMMDFGASSGSPHVAQDRLREEYRATKTPDEMIEKLADGRRAWAAVADRVTNAHLDRPATLSDFMHVYSREHGQQPENTLRGVLLHGGVHLRDHARQLRSASGA